MMNVNKNQNSSDVATEPERQLTGRKLDAAVAERVMAWQSSRVEGIVRYENLDPPRYPTDIAAAMEVVEKMRERFAVDIESRDSPKGWTVTFWADGDIQGESRREELPDAICLAALEAIEAE